MVKHSLDAQKQRKETSYFGNTSVTTQNFTNGDLLLKKLKIPLDSKILIIDAVSPNIPFILLKRSGYTVHNLTKKNLKEALTWNFDFIAIQDYNLVKITNIDPTLSSKIERIGGNRAISIYRIRKETTSNVSVKQLLQLEKETPFYNNSIRKDNAWRNNKLYSNSSVEISQQDEFGLILEIYNNNELLTKNNLVLVKLTIANIELPKGGLLVFNVIEDGKNKSYQTREILLGENLFLFSTPKLHNIDNKMSLYVWNNKKDSILVKDFEVEIY